jgi:hypothetical protein
MHVCAVLLDGPVDDVPLGDLTVRETAARALTGIEALTLRDLPLDSFVVVHDAACPGVTREVIADLLERAATSGRPQVGVRPVTDTVKQVSSGRVGATVDREGLWALAAPTVLPPGAAYPPTDADYVEVPAAARRLADASDVEVLAALLRA